MIVCVLYLFCSFFLVFCSVFFFFFKRKTAYEVRISDWSSDVCSSDLTADERARARDQFADRERLGHIVVGAGVDPLDLFGPVAARRQDQYGHRAPAAAPALQDAEPVEARQAEVEDRQRIILDIALKPGIFAIAAAIDDKARRTQRPRDILGQIRVIFDEPCAPQSSSLFPTAPVRALISTSRTRPDEIGRANV